MFSRILGKLALTIFILSEVAPQHKIAIEESAEFDINDVDRTFNFGGGGNFFIRLPNLIATTTTTTIAPCATQRNCCRFQCPAAAGHTCTSPFGNIAMACTLAAAQNIAGVLCHSNTVACPTCTTFVCPGAGGGTPPVCATGVTLCPVSL